MYGITGQLIFQKHGALIPGIGVSVPVHWDELPELTAGNRWNIRNIDERLKREDPWAEYGAAKRQTIAKAMKALDFLPPKKK